MDEIHDQERPIVNGNMQEIHLDGESDKEDTDTSPNETTSCQQQMHSMQTTQEDQLDRESDVDSETSKSSKETSERDPDEDQEKLVEQDPAIQVNGDDEQVVDENDVNGDGKEACDPSPQPLPQETACNNSDQQQQENGVDSSTVSTPTPSTSSSATQSDLERLRNHLITIEESYTEELIAAQDREKSLRDQLAFCQIHIQNLEDQLRASVIDDLRTQLKKLKSERDTALVQVSKLDDSLQQVSAVKERTHLVLQQTIRGRIIFEWFEWSLLSLFTLLLWSLLILLWLLFI